MAVPEQASACRLPKICCVLAMWIPRRGPLCAGGACGPGVHPAVLSSLCTFGVDGHILAQDGRLGSSREWFSNSRGTIPSLLTCAGQGSVCGESLGPEALPRPITVCEPLGLGLGPCQNHTVGNLGKGACPTISCALLFPRSRCYLPPTDSLPCPSSMRLGAHIFPAASSHWPTCLSACGPTLVSPTCSLSCPWAGSSAFHRVLGALGKSSGWALLLT